MGSFSFKSSGKTQEQQLIEAITKSTIPIGLKTPMRFGTTGGVFAMHLSLADQVHDNLRNLLVTNWGERLGLYDFGANLFPLATEFVSPDDFDATAVGRINTAVKRWMPYVNLEDFLSEVDRTENKNTAVIRITVTYTVPAIQTARRALQVTIYAI